MPEKKNGFFKKAKKAGKGIKEAILKEQRKEADLALVDEVSDILALELQEINELVSINLPESERKKLNGLQNVIYTIGRSVGPDNKIKDYFYILDSFEKMENEIKMKLRQVESRAKSERVKGDISSLLLKIAKVKKEIIEFWQVEKNKNPNDVISAVSKLSSIESRANDAHVGNIEHRYAETSFGTLFNLESDIDEYYGKRARNAKLITVGTIGLAVGTAITGSVIVANQNEINKLRDGLSIIYGEDLAEENMSGYLDDRGNVDKKQLESLKQSVINKIVKELLEKETELDLSSQKIDVHYDTYEDKGWDVGTSGPVNTTYYDFSIGDDKKADDYNDDVYFYKVSYSTSSYTDGSRKEGDKEAKKIVNALKNLDLSDLKNMLNNPELLAKFGDEIHIKEAAFNLLKENAKDNEDR